jgi:hypothetical protein
MTQNADPSTRTPRALAERMSRHLRDSVPGQKKPIVGSDGLWRRETFALPRDEAREKAREWFNEWPKAAYMTEIEFWRELDDGRIEFTMRRLPSAD